MIDRYLNAVAAQLPQDERADIIAELRDLILSRFEAREEEQGRPLTEDEQEAILREIGHPLVVAARYRKGPDRLVGPELFPYWLFGVKAGLLVLLTVQAIGLFIHLISGPADSGQAISHAFHGFFGSALTLIGVATVAAAIFEHYDIRPKWMTQWRVKDLGAFGLSDPAAWGAKVGAIEPPKPPKAPTSPWAPSRRMGGWPGGEYLFSFIAVGMFSLWWVGILRFPGLVEVRLLGADATISPAPIWSALFAPILVYALVQMAVDLNSLFRPYAVRLRALARTGIAAGGLWLTWVIFEAGHWFTLTRGEETARIAGDWVMLDFDTLRTLGDGARDLAGVASTLSVVMVWALAISAISLVCSVFLNLWRLARG
ncbi:MAG: HAAS signaling domain-containing protein [Brevundimonas sp.]